MMDATKMGLPGCYICMKPLSKSLLLYDKTSSYSIIDHFAMCRKELRKAQSILTALATVANNGNPLNSEDMRFSCVAAASPSKLELLLYICTFQELHDTFWYGKFSFWTV